MSLEKIIEQSKIEYYDALGRSSQNWHESDHDLYPWWSFFLSHLRQGYHDLKSRVELSIDGDSITSLIRQQIFSMDIEFKIADILKLNPGIDREIIKKVLTKLKNEKKIKMSGAGKASRWKVINS